MSTQSFGSGSTRVPARRRRVLPVVVAGMVSLGLAACGSSKSKSNAAVKPAAATETTTAAKPATGEPLKVLQVLNELPSSGLLFPEAKAAVQGRIDRLNANGGILGRPVQVDICIAGLDANKAADCARKAVAEHYLAAVGSLFAGAPDYQKILADAGIPHLAGLPFTPGDGMYPTEFPVSAGGPAVVAGQAAFLYDVAGARKIVVAISDSPGASASVDAANSGLASRGAKIAASVPVPRTKTDLSAEVQQAVSSGDSILFAAAGGSLAQFLSQLKTLNYTKFVVPEGSLQPALRKALGNDLLEGVHTISYLATDDMNTAGGKAYLADQQEANPATGSDALGKEAWAGAELLAEAAPKMKSADPQALTQAIQSMTSFDAQGLLPKIDFSKPGTVLPNEPSVRNGLVLFSHVTNGKFVADNGKFLDPFLKP